MMNPLNEFESSIHYTFKNPEHLTEAVTHKSYINEVRTPGMKDNERLEFLGDAVLDLVTSEHLSALYPAAPEGELSKMKSRIVSERALSRIAARLEVGRYLSLGRGEELTGGREKPSILADALEAVIAAIYHDGGYEAARRFILDCFTEEFGLADLATEMVDYKTELQEICQREFDTLPRYHVLRESGPDHEKVFEVELVIRENKAGTGIGKSKKEAEQEAAREALEKIRKTP
jgi:ribonuclease III